MKSGTIKLKKSVLLFALLLAISVMSTHLAAAQTYDGEKINIVQNCEKIFPDLEKLGNAKFRERYLHFENFRACTTLYNNPTWYSLESDRMDKLVSLLGAPSQTKIIRDRSDDAQSIPQWIRDDARRWSHGEEKENVFSYGIRYMMNSKIIKSENIMDYRNCVSGNVCLSQNDFLQYSIKNGADGDAVILTHGFGDVSNNIISVTSKEYSKNNKVVTNFQINKTSGIVMSGTKCCTYQFVHQIPMYVGTKISQHDAEIVSEIVFSFKDFKRPSFIAMDKTKKYVEVIDKETGIVLSSKYQDKAKHMLQTTQLIDTNIIKKDTTIRYDEMKIPSWFKNTVKWWTDGKISDSEYVSIISYLLKNDLMRI